jgi:thiamine-monophosphate kinase
MPCEFDLIQRYFLSASRRSDVIAGIGDDGAVIRPPAGQDVVVSVDTLIEGVHFLACTHPTAIGHKALAVNLSDLAAMGAEPAWATLALTLPKADETWLTGFTQGLLRLMSRHGVELVGGDLTRGPLSITIQVIGLSPYGMAIRRDGARPGDLIFVTGSIGDAGLGLAAIRGERGLDSSRLDYCLTRLNEPSPRITAGLALRDIASAAIDISDGFSTDLKRILNASHVGACVELTSIPLSPAARAVFGNEIDWNLVLAAGDDYELLFTVPADRVQVLKQRFLAMDCGVTHVGYIEKRTGLRYTVDGGACALTIVPGYDHFAG